MSQTRYYLEKKEKDTQILNKAEQLKKDLIQFRSQIVDLGYDSDTVNEVMYILKRSNRHEYFREETLEKKTIPLVTQTGDWKPVYHLGNGYSNLVEMEKWIRLKATHHIVREKNAQKQVLSWFEFVIEVQGLKWTGFGMPKKYNKAEDTIWE